MTKVDIVYTTTKFGSNQYQAIVKLNCMEGQEYAGELAANPKEAEKSAAQQALQAYAAVIASLPPAAVAAKKRKPLASSGGGAGFMPLGAGGSMVGGLKAMGDGENPALTDKVKLNAACMKIAKRALQKGETLYETRQIGDRKATNGYQATVRLSCLPGDWALKLFPGQVCANKQGAEQSAASTAMAAIMQDAELAALVNKDSPGPNGKGGAGKGKGGGKGKGKGWLWIASGPDLPRERVSQAAITGEVIEWKGTFGWIMPHGPVDHEAAAKRDGKVYVHRQDLQGVESLTAGGRVRFIVYADPSGLGAEEVVPF